MANQLFQWSVAQTVASNHNATLLVDSRIVERPDARGEQITPLLRNAPFIRHETIYGARFWRFIYRYMPRPFTALMKRISTTLRSVGKRTIVSTLDETNKHLQSRSSVVMRGLFQEADFLHENREAVLSQLSLAEYEADSGVGAPYAAVHIRRGDYVNNQKYNQIFGVCSEAYYLNALKALSPGLPIVIVTDDAPWAQEFIQKHSEYTDRSSVSTGISHFEDLSILAHATELIISNSTFSWWGAFIGAPTRVICPDPWFTDPGRDRGLRRPDWIQVTR